MRQEKRRKEQGWIDMKPENRSHGNTLPRFTSLERYREADNSD
jgi:hypothetical protein